MRLAIVGLGPKGLFALERLLHRMAADGSRAALVVDAFEPHPVPGAGPVYDPAQPAYLRMNFTDDQIDLWALGNAAVPPSQQRPYAEWRDEHGEDAAVAGYSARADVGRYLADGLRTLLRHTPETVRVTIRPERVHALRRDGDGWRLRTAGADHTGYDEVLLATGHAGAWAGGLARGWPHRTRLVESVFPVERRLGAAAVAPGAVVAVRGFALTFLDAALALTVGRGGRFEPTAHPFRLKYVGGPAEAGVLLPYSRSGRPMLAKPHAGVAAAIGGLDQIGQDGRARLDGPAGVVGVVAGVAAESLGAAGESSPTAAEFAASLREIAAGGRWPSDGGPREELERSLQVATGLHGPDAAWAAGHAWRATYPAIVARLSHGGLPAGDWPRFRRLAAEMERIAFGPSPENAARLLALIEAGRIDLRFAAGGGVRTERGVTRLERGSVRQDVDVVIDAVLPPPGVHDDLVGALIAAGDARVGEGQRGLDVTPDGSCRASDGTLTPGLAAIGRVTEDAVIGNDSLSRTLHPLADRWASRIARQARSRHGEPVLAA